MLRTHVTARRAGAALDRLLPLVPRAVGGRLTALAVEAAARAGRAHGRTDHRDYRSQKDTELAGEARRLARRHR